MFDYDKEAHAATEKLNEYDLRPFLVSCYRNDCRDIDDIMDRLPILYPQLESSMDNLSTDEFLDYLRVMYNAHFYEHITYELGHITMKKGDAKK